MANAYKDIRQTEEIVVKQEEVVVLELTRKEAEVLRRLAYVVGGDPSKGAPRGHMDRIDLALEEAGVERFTKGWFRTEGTVTFTTGMPDYNQGEA